MKFIKYQDKIVNLCSAQEIKLDGFYIKIYFPAKRRASLLTFEDGLTAKKAFNEIHKFLRYDGGMTCLDIDEFSRIIKEVCYAERK